MSKKGNSSLSSRRKNDLIKSNNDQDKRSPPILEESIYNTKSMSNYSEDSDIMILFKGLSNSEDKFIDSDYEYFTNVWENKRRKEKVFPMK